MLDIRDIKGDLVATGDQDTGAVESRHGDRGMRVVLSEGQNVTLTRKGTVTHVTRSHGGFVIDRQYTP